MSTTTIYQILDMSGTATEYLNLVIGIIGTLIFFAVSDYFISKSEK